MTTVCTPTSTGARPRRPSTTSPSSRRVKPLPKRRRTSESYTHAHLDPGGRTSRRTSPNGSEGDYVDRLQQPGNRKTRNEDQPAQRGISTGRERDTEGGVGNGCGGDGGAGLQHKMLLRSRKRKLALVLGVLALVLGVLALVLGVLALVLGVLALVLGVLALVLGVLALDHALSASYPFVQTGIDYRSGAPARMRLSQRRDARIARVFRAHQDSLLSEHADGATPKATRTRPLCQRRPPSSSCFYTTARCEASDRLIATQEEVVILHGRFEEDLARQAAREAGCRGRTQRAAAKRTDRTKAGGGDVQGALDAPAAGAKKGGKKKTRDPTASHAQEGPTAEGAPPPPPPVSTALANPADEWISPFFEHEMSYGDEQNYHRAVRNRKKILRRGLRARERATSVASRVADRPSMPLRRRRRRSPRRFRGRRRGGRREIEGRGGRRHERDGIAHACSVLVRPCTAAGRATVSSQTNVYAAHVPANSAANLRRQDYCPAFASLRPPSPSQRPPPQHRAPTPAQHHAHPEKQIDPDAQPAARV
ncbi:uncharacterized protein TRAVEDRAFT_20106 [Trametes versicolor FP-101664 SS1]|uniref:uncharacterized protein n=1 Tax=Trametes versicolor (strain FP-101664) TaxID=717944 RepID=UPI0004624043|nr:uncharacterized protein TRAVEDRAFT_20106 [Trametes versicolor FP-101664 SS1]EIW59816.1 hypothetical protein TRAVEDRAFT_20106 [Trametes versicolor FP-101664 SS1]